MSKLMKKVLSIVAAIAMVLTMAVPVAAATVTIDPANTGSEDGSGTPTYTYYKMMEASVGENGAVSYYVEDQTKATALDKLKVGDDDLFTVTKASGTDRWNIVINKKADSTDFTGEEVAAALDTIKSNAIQTGNVANNQFTITGNGYVLVESSLGTKLVLNTVTDKTIQEKNTYPTLTKTEDKKNTEIGGTVTYTVNVGIPANVAEKEIVVYDTISDGLTLNTSVTVSGAVENPAYTSVTFSENTSYTATNGEKQYTLTIPAATVKANAGKTLTLTYTAVLNNNAVVKEEESNKAHLTYDNFTTIDSEVKVTTFGFELDKVDGSKNPLSGVKFTLTRTSDDTTYYYDADQNPRFGTTSKDVTTGTDGKITFAGLAEGTYTLTETKTLDGYNLLTSPITVKIDKNGNATFEGAEAADNVVTVVNNTGSELPSTGGMGTTIFYVLGAALVIGAGVVLVTRKRLS